MFECHVNAAECVSLRVEGDCEPPEDKDQMTVRFWVSLRVEGDCEPLLFRCDSGEKSRRVSLRVEGDCEPPIHSLRVEGDCEPRGLPPHGGSGLKFVA